MTPKSLVLIIFTLIKKREYYIQLYHEKHKKNTRKNETKFTTCANILPIFNYRISVQIVVLYLPPSVRMHFPFMASHIRELDPFGDWKNVNQISMGNSIVFEFLTLAHTRTLNYIHIHIQYFPCSQVCAFKKHDSQWLWILSPFFESRCKILFPYVCKCMCVWEFVSNDTST